MRKSGICIFLLMLCIVAPAFAGCPSPHGFFPETWLATYDGTIGSNTPIRMTLSYKDDQLVGQYFYAEYLENISVEGSSKEDRSFTLSERDRNGETVAVFSGNFSDTDPKGNYSPSSRLSCEVLTGEWKSSATGRSLPFYLSLRFAQPGKLGDRYRAWAGHRTDEASIENIAKTFVRAVREGDKLAVARLLRYPFLLEGRGGTRIRNASDLLKNYDQVFTTSKKELIAQSVPMHMTVGNYDLISLSWQGGPWIGPDLKIRLWGWERL